jgi:hypothetical protein
LHDGIVVQSVLWRPSVFELREHGRGGHRGNTSTNCCHTIPRRSNGPGLWTAERNENTAQLCQLSWWETLFTLTCFEPETGRCGRHCSKAEYTFLYFQIFCGFSVVLTEIIKTLLFIWKIIDNTVSFASEFLNKITIVPICFRWPFTQSHAYPDMTVYKYCSNCEQYGSIYRKKHVTHAYWELSNLTNV